MVTKIEKSDLARDALYEKVNQIASELELPDTTNNEGKVLVVGETGKPAWGDASSVTLRTWAASEGGGK